MGRVDIVPDGDVILVVQDQVELRVYSIVLKLASAVFKAMLGPHFAEGQVQGTPTDPKSVSLQEDSTEQPPQVALIEDLAIVADKYGCMNAAHFVLESWISQINILRCREPGSFIHVTYLLDDAEAFMEPTETIIGDGRSIKAWPEASHDAARRIHAKVKSRQESILRIIDQYSYDAADMLIKSIGPQHEHYCGHRPGHEPGERNEDGDEFEMDYDGSTPKKCSFAQDYMLKHLKLLAGAHIWPRGAREGTVNQLLKAVADFDIDYATRHEDVGWRTCNSLACEEWKLKEYGLQSKGRTRACSIPSAYI